jgi:uridine kinase
MIEETGKRDPIPDLTYSSDNIPYKKLWEALSWATDIGCVTLEQLGGLAQGGGLGDLVRASEAFYERELDGAVERILQRRKDLRIVIIAGPSSSGKTTTTIKVKDRLEKAGVATAALSADHYFFGLDRHPRVGDDYDFETPQALDLELINVHLGTLIGGGTVEVPKDDFKAGKRDGVSAALSLRGGEVLLMDSHHGLFPGMTAAVPERMKARLYIETLSVLRDSRKKYIRWADVRMLRRMVRDAQFRNFSPRETVRHWHLVRRSELRYIVPELTKAHAIVNSFLPYELPVMKGRVQAWIDPMREELGGDPSAADALERICRVRDMLREVPAAGEDIVPPTSLLREFIGGSALEYR